MAERSPRTPLMSQQHGSCSNHGSSDEAETSVGSGPAQVAISVSRHLDEPSGSRGSWAGDDPDSSVRLSAYEDDAEAKEERWSETVGAASPLPSPPSTVRRASRAGLSEDEEAHREEFLKVARMNGYQFSWIRELRYWIACMCTAFTLCLFGLWFPDTVIPWRYKRVPLRGATLVHVFGRVHGAELVPVLELGQDIIDAEAMQEQQHPHMERRSMAQARRSSQDLLHAGHGGRMILFRHMRYIYSPSAQQFILQESDVVTRRTEGLAADKRHTSVAGLKAKELTERMRIGLSREQMMENRVLYGENALVLKVPTIPELLFSEIFHPFYVFQMYSVILWYFEAYYYYSGAIIIIATVSIVQTLIETRRRMREMAALARFDCEVEVFRDSTFKTVSSTQLVPGDIVRVQTGLMPCDLVLLEGGCVVNESMLTGESVPVVKVNVQWPVQRLGENVMELTSDPRHTLFSATKVLQLKPLSAQGDVTAIVVRTGFSTTKGALLLSILYPQPSTFQFVSQSYKFIAALFCLAMVGFGVSVWQLLAVQHAGTSTIVIRALDLITIVVPPSLPLALTVGTNFAIMWLRDEKIFCISPSRITMAGKVRLMCFDKTGTLTAESLEFSGVFPAELDGDGMEQEEDNSAAAVAADPSHRPRFGRFQSPRTKMARMHMSNTEVMAGSLPDGPGHPSDVSEQVPLGMGDGAGVHSDDADLELGSGGMTVEGVPDIHRSVTLSSTLKIALACCQSLAVMDDELIGDPLEQQTFEAAGAALQDTGDLRGFQQLVRLRLPGDQHRTMGVHTQFEFSSSLQRMSVLCTDLDNGKHYAFVKGSPEMMETLCVASSLPADFRTSLGFFARKGYRVIAIARKRMAEIPVMDKAEMRVVVERDLTFLGLVLLENKLKPETEPTLQNLKRANIRCCMITGDNPLTAVTVAKECKLVDPDTRIFQSMLIPDPGMISGVRLEWRDTDDDQLVLDPVTLKLPPEVMREWKGPSFKYELAMTGSAFKLLQDADGSSAPTSYFHRVLLNTQIAARFSPDQKASLVAELQGMGIYCGMCGDGANDCGALKTAHVGVSLSESEASIAAPFTYQRPNISCIPILLAEGRSSLVTSFQLFRFMAMYSMIQFCAVILTYFQGSVLGNWQYLYADLFTVFPLTIFMGATRANRQLSVKRPSGNLLSTKNIFNLIVHMLICVAFQVAVTESISNEPDYVKLDNPDNGPWSYNTTALYYFSNFAYVVIAVLFSVGAPWKKSVLSNWKFSVWTLVSLACSSAMILSPVLEPAFFREDDVPLPWSWRRTICAWVLLYTASAVLWDVMLCPLLCLLAAKWAKQGLPMADVFGIRKPMEGPKVKLFHKMRGEFEANWNKEACYS